VLGAGIYLGTESDRRFDELEADRRAGVLTSDDSRASTGKWFAIGADAGFVLSGVLAGLATYNFIKDPLPESSIRLQPKTEFDSELPKAARARRPALARSPRQRTLASLREAGAFE
jgi:hypothetical protein